MNLTELDVFDRNLDTFWAITIVMELIYNEIQVVFYVRLRLWEKNIFFFNTNHFYIHQQHTNQLCQHNVPAEIIFPWANYAQLRSPLIVLEIIINLKVENIFLVNKVNQRHQSEQINGFYQPFSSVQGSKSKYGLRIRMSFGSTISVLDFSFAIQLDFAEQANMMCKVCPTS